MAYQVRNLRASGEVSVTEWNEPIDPEACILMLMGPTGAGKSTFIEALAGPATQLGISNPQLRLVTQEATAYKIINAEWVKGDIRKPVFLLDCPGSCDARISEYDVLKRVRKWMKQHRVHYIHHLLFFTPITDSRLPVSKRVMRDVISELAQLGPDNDKFAQPIMIVTTLWDTLWNEDMRNRANKNLANIRDDTFKEMFLNGAEVTDFRNTQSSAINVVDAALSSMSSGQHISGFGPNKSIFDIHAVHTELYGNLQGRRDKARLLESVCQDDLDQPDGSYSPEHKAILKAQLKEARQDVSRYQAEMNELGLPPPADSENPNTSPIVDAILSKSRIKEGWERILNAWLFR